MKNIKAFHGVVFSYAVVRFGAVNHSAPHHTILPLTKPHRTASHRRILEKNNPHRTAPHRTAPHRTAKKKRTTPHRRIIPHRRVWWQSVEQAFLTVRIELIRREKAPRTVSSNHVNRVKCCDLYGDSDAELQNWCKVGRLKKF